MKPNPSNLREFVATRTCQACGVAIPDERPLHAKYCDDPVCLRFRKRAYYLKRRGERTNAE